MPVTVELRSTYEAGVIGALFCREGGRHPLNAEPVRDRFGSATFSRSFDERPSIPDQLDEEGGNGGSGETLAQSRHHCIGAPAIRRTDDCRRPNLLAARLQNTQM